MNLKDITLEEAYQLSLKADWEKQWGGFTARTSVKKIVYKYYKQKCVVALATSPFGNLFIIKAIRGGYYSFIRPSFRDGGFSMFRVDNEEALRVLDEMKVKHPETQIHTIPEEIDILKAKVMLKEIRRNGKQ